MPANEPTLTATAINGLPAITLNGAVDGITNSYMACGRAFSFGTMVIVANYTYGTTFRDYPGLVSNGARNSYMWRGDYGGSTSWRSLSPGYVGENGDGITKDQMWINQVQTKNMSPLKDIFKVISGNYSNGTTPTKEWNDGIILGWASTNTQVWQGNIAEFFVFSTIIPASDRRAVENYLRKKYGI